MFESIINILYICKVVNLFIYWFWWYMFLIWEVQDLNYSKHPLVESTWLKSIKIIGLQLDIITNQTKLDIMSTKVEQELKENVVYVRHKWTRCASYLAVKRLLYLWLIQFCGRPTCNIDCRYTLQKGVAMIFETINKK